MHPTSPTCHPTVIMPRPNTRKSSYVIPPRQWLVALLLLVVAAPVLAGAGGLQKVTTTFTELRTMMLGLGAILMTIAIMWAGYKMIFQHARWGDIAFIVIGGILVGGAAAFAGWFMQGAGA